MNATEIDMPAGELRENEPMARHTTWRVGGPARLFYRPAGVDDLAAFLADLDPALPVLMLGLGSNLLVRDGGFPGAVIALQGALDRLVRIAPDSFEAEAGVTCAKLAREVARAGLAGAEFLAGIPGTVGGALAMNAGAFGGETWEAVTAVQTVDRRGVLRWRGSEDYRVGYRQVQGPEGEWFVAGRFRYAPGDVGAAQNRIRSLLARRGETQPTRQPSCGSVFRNPPGDHAARLIEAAGLKGCCIGGACVSELHANFIVNTGTATAADIEVLIRHVQERVASQFGVRLEPEVRIVGVPA